MRFISSLILLGFAGLLHAQTSYVAPTKILSKKGYQMGISGDYFRTSKRVDDKGTKIPYQDDESFTRTQGEFFGQYGLTDNLQIGGGVRFRQNQSKAFNSATSLVEDESSSGVESTYLSLIFAFKPVDRWQYTAEGLFRFRPFTNDESTTTSRGNLILGDDGNEYQLGLGLTYNFPGLNYFTARGGYRNPGQDLSTEIYWQVEGALTWKQVALVAGVDGTSSMKNGAFEDDPTQRPNFYTGSTNLYNSINREYIAPYVGLNFALGNTWRMELRGSQVVSGKSTDLGTSFGASLIRRVDTNKLARVDRRFKDYDFEANITKISPKKEFVVIDKGLSQNVEKGLKIDFYEFDYFGGNVLIAAGVVIQAKSEISVVKITQRYNSKKELKEGVVARGSFR